MELFGTNDQTGKRESSDVNQHPVVQMTYLKKQMTSLARIFQPAWIAKIAQPIQST